MPTLSPQPQELKARPMFKKTAPAQTTPAQQMGAGAAVVRPEYRRAGVGRRLLAELEPFAAGQGV